MRVLSLLLAAIGGALVAMIMLRSPASLIELWQDPCRGFCGPQSQCKDRRCEIAPARSEPSPLAKKPASRKKTRRRRPTASAGVKLPWANDRKVPAFKANAVQQIQANDESGRLDQHDIDAVLAKLQPAWIRCVERADTRAGGELPEGRVRLSFGVNGSGKVTGVSAKAPKALRIFGIVPCVRLAIYGARFPAYRGPDTRVESHFDVAF